MIDPQKIWSSSQLPTLPMVAVRLLDLSRNPEADVKAVVSVIKSDPAISAKILKSTNSSFFGFRSEVTSIDRAVPLLGTTVVTSLALSFSLVEAAMNNGPLVKHYNDYWMHSVVQAAAAEMLGEQSGRGLDCEYFLTGLLIDIGRLAMLKTIGADYVPVLNAAQQQGRNLHTVEAELLGFDHVEIGVKLMQHWKLPEALIAAVARHHAPLEEILEAKGAPHFELVRSAAVAACVGDYFCRSNKGPALALLKLLTSELYRFSPHRLDEFLARTKSRIDQAGELFPVDTAELGDPSELMAMANEHLAQLALKEHIAGAQATVRHQEAEREKLELETRNRELQNQAVRDPLTKTYNRAYFDEALAKEVGRCSREAAPVGVIFSDIDNFKLLNDTYGHQFGDHVLQRVAGVFGSALRKCDVLARYGGEEFVVLVGGPTEKGLRKLAERIRAAVENEQIEYEGARVPVTVSLGAALAIPPRNENNTGTRLIAAADAAMYESKQNGRNQARVRSLLEEHERRLFSATLQRRLSRWLVQRGLFHIPALSRCLLECPTERVPLGELARREEYLDANQVRRILAEQNHSGQRFGAAALKLGLLTEDQLVHLLVLQQEDPHALVRTLVRLGHLTPKRGAALLQQYLEETTLPPPALNRPSML